MADVKVCGKCGMSISQQEIIEGKAKLADGRLVCGDCAQKSAAAAARPMAASKSAAISLPDSEPEAMSQSQSPLGVGGTGQAAGDSPMEMQTFGAGVTHGRKEAKFTRQPHVSGTGPIRVRTFDTKLTRAALEVLDEQINVWLDESGVEVKLVTTTIGDVQGKVTEQHLIVNVWY
jgi:hypothetical protein